MLKYLGRASVKITTINGTVIYIDPYAGSDYSEPADLIKAKWNVPIHSDPENDYNEANVKAFTLSNTIYLKPGDSVELKP